jgi:hypothetical protein
LTVKRLVAAGLWLPDANTSSLNRKVCKMHRWNIAKMMLLAALAVLCSNTALGLTKYIDKRTYTDASGNRYYVVFCARPVSLPSLGHAFVTWGMEDYQRRISIATAFGFYPSSVSGKAAYGYVPGSIRSEAFNPASTLITEKLIVEVNREAYWSSQYPISTWATSNYNLFTNNCIGFVRDVASKVRILVPPRGILDTPSWYTKKLIWFN